MKNITWRSCRYKYRDSTAAFINEVRVAVVTPLHDGSRFDAKCMLPGMPKGVNSYSKLETAMTRMEEMIHNWFRLVEQ